MDAKKKANTADAVMLGMFGTGVYQHGKSMKLSRSARKETFPLYKEGFDLHEKGNTARQQNKLVAAKAYHSAGDKSIVAGTKIMAEREPKIRAHGMAATGLYVGAMGAAAVADHYSAKTDHAAYYERTQNGKKERVKNPNFNKRRI